MSTIATSNYCVWSRVGKRVTRSRLQTGKTSVGMYSPNQETWFNQEENREDCEARSDNLPTGQMVGLQITLSNIRTHG